MERHEIINSLIKKFDYKSYCEIGTQGFVCMKKIKCAYKVGVDPQPAVEPEREFIHKFYCITSDNFFVKNKEKFDVIFIDGLHHEDQVRKDIGNSLDILNEGGCIVVHDCNPQSYEAQVVPYIHTSTWNGNVYLAWIHFRRRFGFEMFVVDSDEGCGVLRKGQQTPLTLNSEPTYELFSENKKEWLNLISVEQFKNWLNENV